MVNISKSANYDQFDTLCNRGTITRLFNALDSCGNADQCSQRVVVNYLQDYYIKFPNDAIVTVCNSTGVYGEPFFFGEDCELLAVSYEDETIDPVPDACLRIVRNWTIINWCTYDPALPLINVPNPNPNPIPNSSANLPGPTVSACNTPLPWKSSKVKISPTDTAATDFCIFWNANANGYRYKQIIKIIDGAPPEIANCPLAPTFLADSTENNPDYWNNVFNPNAPAKNLSEVPVDLTIQATDGCSGGNLNLQYLLFLDLDGNGSWETVVNSMNPPPADTVFYGNSQFPNYMGGTPTAFDNRPVPQNQKWRFAIQRTYTNPVTASVRWTTEQMPNIYTVPELPIGRHLIRWLVTDNCGNLSECDHEFTVKPSTFVGSQEPETDGFALFQNEPNPFSNNTVVRFQLPEPSTATLSVFDAEGRMVYRQTADYSQGEHSVTLDKARLGLSGVLFYKLEAGAHVAWRKMVLLR